MTGCISVTKSQQRLVDWQSIESQERLKQLQTQKQTFFPLSNHFQSQLDGISCGTITGAIVP